MMPFMKMQAPPRHTPVSMKSPGTSSRMAVSQATRRFRIRAEPIMVCASAGQSRPSARSVGL